MLPTRLLSLLARNPVRTRSWFPLFAKSAKNGAPTVFLASARSKPGPPATRRSVKDVRGQCVKDVMGPNTFFARAGGAMLPARLLFLLARNPLRTRSWFPLFAKSAKNGAPHGVSDISEIEARATRRVAMLTALEVFAF